MAMMSKRRLGGIIALFLAIGPTARASDGNAVVKRAAELLEEISSTPDSGIPPHFLQEARGITIVPHMVETQLGLGRKKGNGVYLSRDEKGEWGEPELVSMAALSAGPEVGRTVTDVVILYRTRKAADKVVDHKLILGASFNVQRLSRHPVKFEGPEEDGKAVEEILTYKRRSGMVVGVRFVGEFDSKTSMAPNPRKAAPEPKPSAEDKVAKTDRPEQKSEHGGLSPEAVRLKAALAALTTPPPGEVAEKGTKDPQVGQASGAVAPAGAASPPR